MKIKKVAALALAAVMGASMLAGCASKSIDEDAVVVKMKDGEVRLGVANFMARYTQYTYDSIYGSYFKDDYWSQDMSGKGKTMEEEVKSQVMDSLKTYYALAAHADDYGVKITKEDKKKIEKAAKKFISDNSKDAVTEMSATEEDVEEYLRLVTIQQRMQAKIEEDVNANVSDEEAAQRTFSYVFVSTEGTTTEDGKQKAYSDAEKKVLRQKAQALAAVKPKELESKAEEAGLTVAQDSYGSAKDENSSLDKKVLKAADKLKANEMSGVVETDKGYYVIRLDSEFDQKATDEKKDEIIGQRQQELYQKVCDEYTSDFKFDIDKKVWKQVKFDNHFKAKETTETKQD